MNSSIQKVIASLVFVITVIVGGYTLYSKDITKNGSGMSDNNRQISQDILDLSQKLKMVSIDPSFFQSPLFLGLRDFSPILVPENTGKQNPFAQTESGTTTKKK